MGPHKLDAIGNLPLQHPGCPLDDILMSQGLFAFCPALYPFKQGSGEIPARLPCGQNRI